MLNHKINHQHHQTGHIINKHFFVLFIQDRLWLLLLLDCIHQDESDKKIEKKHNRNTEQLLFNAISRNEKNNEMKKPTVIVDE